MPNIFQCTYDERLKSWYDLRNSIKDSDISTKCVAIDQWWQSAPLVNHYLHVVDIDSWPGPWELIAENHYCQIARGLGMIYTLLLTGIQDVDFLIAKDHNDEEVSLVWVECAKCMLNYWPGSVLNTDLKDFEIKNKIDIEKIKRKI